MSLEKRDFYAKEVALAIKNACDTLGVAQEQLEIEVIETGTTGIFGLIRKKAHIRVVVKPDIEDAGITTDVFAIDVLNSSSQDVDSSPESLDPYPVVPEKSEPVRPAAKPQPVAADSEHEERKTDDKQDLTAADDDDDDESIVTNEPEKVISPENLEIVKTELLELVRLMGFPSTVEMESVGQSVSCTLRGEFEENLTGADGKVLDSLQYILRKIVSRKASERLRISINVGDFREKRLDELKVRAVELAAQVKEDGKTQVLPALNPSERRIIHLILQEDKEIRSRSVGDGMFKKILIYKPGKGNKPSGRKRSTKGRSGKAGSKKGSDS